jgi:hypothetical protein
MEQFLGTPPEQLGNTSFELLDWDLPTQPVGN